MCRCRPARHVIALVLAILSAADAAAFMRWDESRNQIFATASATMAYDSNIYTVAGGDGDMIYTAALGLEYQRRAGLIGVNSSVLWTPRPLR